MQRILYFTADRIPTAGEIAEIAKLNALAAPQLEVIVMNGKDSPNYGAGQITGDYLAGTVPASYDDGGPIYPLFDPDNPPAPANLPATQAVVSDTQVIALAEPKGDHTLTVVDGEVTDIDLEATKKIVSDGDVLNVDGGGTVELTIAGGVITGVAYTAP